MYRATYIKYPLKFRFKAGTSRGVLREKDSWFIFILKEGEKGVGVGEVSVIPGLSIDDVSIIEDRLENFCSRVSEGGLVSQGILNGMPAVRFGIETALQDLANGGGQVLYRSKFLSEEKGIPINGLIWMNEADKMLQQVREKLEQGFRILKFKVGAIDFQEELELLKKVRGLYSEDQLEIRLDANGAWKPEEALEKLKVLSEYGIHSLEQAIRAGQHEAMAGLCEDSPIAIALDEELIGIEGLEEKRALLQKIRPAYIILKPSLLGGIAASEEWIDAAASAGVGWWVTSALESNIGLNAIAQWTASLNTSMPQGLGTGMIYSNNISSPLYIKDAMLWHDEAQGFDFSEFNIDEGWI